MCSSVATFFPICMLMLVLHIILGGSNVPAAIAIETDDSINKWSRWLRANESAAKATAHNADMNVEVADDDSGR
jgi:hypothetical protein